MATLEERVAATQADVDETTTDLQSLIQYANETTGESDTTMSDAVGHLVSGYGGGSSPFVEIASEEFTIDEDFTSTSTTAIADLNLTMHDVFGLHSSDLFAITIVPEFECTTGFMGTLLVCYTTMSETSGAINPSNMNSESKYKDKSNYSLYSGFAIVRVTSSISSKIRVTGRITSNTQSVINAGTYKVTFYTFM